MTLKVFCDLHHGDLYYSLHKLFVERLGFELYRPIGMDWFHEGYWKIAAPYNHALDTVGQYLDINHASWAAQDVSNMPWDDYVYKIHGNHYLKDDVYHVFEPVHEYHQKAITFAKFKSMKFDIIMPTVSLHDHVYEDLRNKYQPHAKIIAHLGNTGQRTHLPNVIHSVPYSATRNQNTVLVHQELDSNLYKYVPPSDATKNIFSVVNCYPYKDIYTKYKNSMTDINWKYYGSGSPDGSLFGARGVGEKMREANIGWQLKPLGGLGHSAMGWLFSGRPVIVNMSQHRSWGGNALALFEPGVTCHDIEAHSPEENVKMIRKMLEPEETIKWCERARKRFLDIINYDVEEQAVRKFLEVLK